MHKKLLLSVVSMFAAVLTVSAIGRAQDASLAPTTGALTWKTGSGRMTKKAEAGGDLKTKEGGVEAWINKAPDFKVDVQAGKYPVMFWARSDIDTTLLVKLPNGKFLANDDAPGANEDSMVIIENAPSGTYFVWIGAKKQGRFSTSFIVNDKLR